MPVIDEREGDALIAAERGDRLSLALLAATCVVATIAFWAYTRTLLPGVDLGDTGGFQAGVLWREPTARRAYPLYFALAAPFTQWLSAANPARGLNLFSAVWAGVATGLLTFLVGRLTRFTLAGVVAGLLLAFSHTFWTQAVIAEVYSLHLSLVAMCLIALYVWSRRPTTIRLGIFFVVYALAFGNHLSTILLLVPCTVFLFLVHPNPRQLLRPSIIVLALVIAAAGAMQYAQSFTWLWTSIETPPAWTDRIAAFWLDATKSDWRADMVFGVHPSQLRDRLAMVWWDSRQQFGLAGLALAAFGALRVWTVSGPWAVFLWLAYIISTLFALTYNVGDTHVFLLPSHFFTAMAAGIALTPWRAVKSAGTKGAAILFPYTPPPPSTRPTRSTLPAPSTLSKTLAAPSTVLAVLALIYAGWRGWETWPAVDRHADRRADALLSRLTQDVDERSALLVTKMDWQIENIALYSGRYERPGLAWVRLDDVLPHFPFLVRDNLAEGRDIVLTADAAREVRSTFGDTFPIVQDQPGAPSVAALAKQVPRGAAYILTWLAPPPVAADLSDLNAGVGALLNAGIGVNVNAGIGVPKNGSPPARADAGYEVWAGIAGEEPAYHRSSANPFVDQFAIAGDVFTVRMDSWLPEDTFRRGGFGHILRGREHVLWIERGVSLMWLKQNGEPAQVYAAGLYAPEARFRITAPPVRLARKADGRVQSQ
ncbi:MAG TPA: DUF2723 domain-containing protein [Vicinamibacterales bacterium]